MDTGKVDEDQNFGAGAQSQKGDNDKEKLDILAEKDESNDDGQDAGKIQFDLTSYINDHKEIIQTCKLIGREISFFWTVFYFLFFHQSNEVTNKYYGLYFVGFCLIIRCEAIFSHKIGHYMNLEPLDFFNYPLKALFSVFVSFVGEIEGRDGRLSMLQPKPKYLACLPLMIFTLEMIVQEKIVQSKFKNENRPFKNQCYLSNSLSKWMKENSAKLTELRRQEKEIERYFFKKWLVDFAIVTGSAILAHLTDLSHLPDHPSMPILQFYGLILVILIKVYVLVPGPISKFLSTLQLPSPKYSH